jgi:hypothetical protein
MGPVDDSVTTNTKSPSHKVTKGAGPTRAAWSAVAFSLVLAVCVLTGMQGRALNMGSCSGMKHPGRERLSRPLPHWRQLVAGQLLVDGQRSPSSSSSIFFGALVHLRLNFVSVRTIKGSSSSDGLGISQLATVYAAHWCFVFVVTESSTGSIKQFKGMTVAHVGGHGSGFPGSLLSGTLSSYGASTVTRTSDRGHVEESPTSSKLADSQSGVPLLTPIAPFQGFARQSGIQVFRLYSTPSPVTENCNVDL